MNFEKFLRTQALPSKLKPSKIMTLTSIVLIGRSLILLKIATEEKEGQTILLTENADDVKKCKSTNIVLANSNNPHLKPFSSNNDKWISHFEKKRRPDTCFTENFKN